jgi:hypothetical protein
VRRLLLVAFVVLLVGTTAACDAFGDDVAATVEGKDISIDAVTALAKEPVFNRTGGASTESVMDGTAARAALTTLIQFNLAASELARRGAHVTAADRQTVDQQYGQDAQISAMKPAARKVVLDSIAQEVALDRVLREIDPTSAQERHELFDRTPSSHKVRCFEALVAPAANETQVENALDSGASISDVLTKGTGGAQAIFGNGQQCRSRNQIPAGFPAEVTSLIFDAPIGQTASVKTQSGTTDVVVIVHATADRTLHRDDPEVGDLVAAVKQGGISAWLPLVMVDARVVVNPQFGRAYSVSQGVIPPISPPVKGPPSSLTPTQPSP